MQASYAGQGINLRVENEARGLVKDLIGEGSLNNSVKLVFTNALYFKGSWGDEEPNPVLGSKEFGRFYNDDISLLDQTYNKKQSEEEDKHTSSLHFYYPLEDTEQGLISQTLMEASNVLSSLARIALPFSGGDLSGILSTYRHLNVVNIFQKAFIEVNEQDTEAAAATVAIVMKSECSPCLLAIPPIIRQDYNPLFLYDGTYDECGRPIYAARTELMIRQLVNSA